MTELTNPIACTMVNILSLLVLAPLPFRDSLRLNLRWIVVLAVLLCVIYATASLVCHAWRICWKKSAKIFACIAKTASSLCKQHSMRVCARALKKCSFPSVCGDILLPDFRNHVF